MENFIGHLVAGLMSIIFGFWWFRNVMSRFFIAKRFSRPYKNVSSFPLKRICGWKLRCSVEGISKIVFSLTLLIGEVAMSLKHGHCARLGLGNVQHVIIYGLFLLNGITDIYMPKTILKIFPNAQYLTLNLAFLLEAFLFSTHLDGQNPMNTQLHTLLTYIILGCLICTMAEVLHPQSVLPALGRAFCTCFQGTWLIQIGFVLFFPLSQPWDQRSREQIIGMYLSFTCHILLILLIFVGLICLIWRRIENIKLPGAADGEDPEANASSNTDVTIVVGTDADTGAGDITDNRTDLSYTGSSTSTVLAYAGAGTRKGVAFSGATLYLVEKSIPVHV